MNLLLCLRVVYERKVSQFDSPAFSALTKKVDEHWPFPFWMAIVVPLEMHPSRHGGRRYRGFSNKNFEAITDLY